MNHRKRERERETRDFKEICVLVTLTTTWNRVSTCQLLLMILDSVSMSALLRLPTQIAKPYLVLPFVPRICFNFKKKGGI